MAVDIDLRNHPPLLDQSKVDFLYIVETFKNHSRRDIDLLGLLIAMKKNKFINENKFRRLKRSIVYSTVQLCDFLPQMLLHLSVEQLCYLFENEGYTDIASELKSTRFFLLYKKPPKKKMPFSRRTHDYYKTLKSCVDCGSFKGGARSQLREFIQRQDEILVSTLHSTKHDRQFAMERKSAAIVLLIQQYKNNEERKQILEQAIATETNDIDNSSLQIIYHSKMALTEAQSGNICQAEEHIVQTKILCQMFGPCFAVTSAFHDIQYTHKILYFMNPSKEMLEKIISDGDMGMQSLTDEKEDVQNLWRRIMLLYIALSLLFITADFIVTDMSKISKADKKGQRRS